MTTYRISTVCLALATLAAMPLMAAPAEAKGGDRLIRRCTATGAGDISMSARYELRGTRKKFSVEFEAAPRGAFTVGQRLGFTVAGKPVGSDALVTVIGGDLMAELAYDTNARPGDDEVPFPAGFPAVGRGTQVVVKSGAKVILSCALN